MGIRTVMITGDNPLTAKAIATRPVLTTSLPRRPRKTRCASSSASRKADGSSR